MVLDQAHNIGEKERGAKVGALARCGKKTEARLSIPADTESLRR